MPENTDPDFVLKYIDIGNVDSSGKIAEIVEYKFEDAPSRARRKVKHGDVIISTVRTYLKAIAPIQEPPENLIVSTGFAVVRPFSEVFNDNYCKYVLREPSFIAEVEKNSVGVSYPAINASDLANLFVPIPPIDEQRAIAAMLDRETARLDELITEKERLLELFAEKRRALITNAVTRGLDPNAPLVDSGVEWLGKIPQHWRTPPIYARYHIQLGKMLDERRITGTQLGKYLRNVDVQWGKINLENLPEMDFSSEDRKRYNLKFGDVLVCEGGEIGRTAIWKENLEDYFYQKAIHRLRPRTEEDFPDFFLYVMYAMVNLGVFVAMSSASTILHLPAEKLSIIRYASPPFEEQREIVEYIEAETGKIDRLQAATRETVELLKERRSSLIAAAVTGKISVR